MTTKTNPSPEAQKILSLIENVDPNDTAALDEIDGAVWCWLNGYRHVKNDLCDPYNFIYYFGEGEGDWRFGSIYDKSEGGPRRYTRSRDALKAIRPDGWLLNIEWDGEEILLGLFDANENSDKAFYHTAPTEELAELHAIIQAIDYTRGKK